MGRHCHDAQRRAKLDPDTIRIVQYVEVKFCYGAAVTVNAWLLADTRVRQPASVA
jgi:hypothetical protein